MNSSEFGIPQRQTTTTRSVLRVIGLRNQPKHTTPLLWSIGCEINILHNKVKGTHSHLEVAAAALTSCGDIILKQSRRSVSSSASVLIVEVHRSTVRQLRMFSLSDALCLMSEAETESMGNITLWLMMSSRSKRTRSRLIFPMLTVGDKSSTRQDALIMFPPFYSYNKIVSSSPKLHPTSPRIHTCTKLEYHIKIGIGSSDTSIGHIPKYDGHKGLSPEKVAAEGQIEIVTLTKVNHQNLVKFLGCCLETEAPV
ncbi:hypothetical protein ACE6H2_009315 [Prunus campanulata]